MVARYAAVDPTRVGIIGWSHGGLITLLAITRNPTTFKAAAAIVPVTNLFQRLARKGVEQQRRLIDPQNRFGGTPDEKPNVYRERSPLFHIDKLRIPLLVHVADNDEDVDVDEAMQLVDALRARKPGLADVKVYRGPLPSSRPGTSAPPSQPPPAISAPKRCTTHASFNAAFPAAAARLVSARRSRSPAPRCTRTARG